jgi:hypothetical protein
VSTVLQLADGLAKRCESISGLKCYHAWLPSPSPPALCVGGPIRWTYDETMGAEADGEDEEKRVWTPIFELTLTVNGADLYRAQEAAYPYLAPSGTRSIPAAIYRDPTLGGVAYDTRVIGSTRPPVLAEVAGGHQLQAVLEVEVTAV